MKVTQTNYATTYLAALCTNRQIKSYVQSYSKREGSQGNYQQHQQNN